MELYQLEIAKPKTLKVYKGLGNQFGTTAGWENIFEFFLKNLKFSVKFLNGAG